MALGLASTEKVLGDTSSRSEVDLGRLGESSASFRAASMLALSPEKRPASRPSYRVRFGYSPRRRKERRWSS